MSPFTDHHTDSVSAWGEATLITNIREWMEDLVPPSPRGIGDDAAVLPPLPPGEARVLTTDGLVWNTHFDASASPEAAGRKLVNRNLSDLAAMGARPVFILLNLQLASNVSKIWIQRFFAGIASACRPFGVQLLGGDITGGPPEVFSATITAGGDTPTAVTRTGGREGDSIWVTGSLGGSRSGKHLDFQPRVEEGIWLRERGDIHSMIDVTDGLAKDLPALVPAGLQARVDPGAIPLSRAARELAVDERAALTRALRDGEDFELLFSLEAKVSPGAFKAAWKARFGIPVTRIGRLAPVDPEVPGRVIHATTGASLDAAWGRGFEHLDPESHD